MDEQAQRRSLHIYELISVIIHFFPFIILLGMLSALFLLDAVLPLQGMMSNDVLLTQLSTWTLLPSHLLFPGRVIALVVPGNHVSVPYLGIQSWRRTALLMGTLLSIFLLYALALRYLPRRITRRYLLISTLLLGFICMLLPVATSSDLFSYIAYARMPVLYHLNPLTTLPIAIHTDPIYRYLYWDLQPSAYGPMWALLTSLFQWLLNISGLGGIVWMVLALRLLGLAMHLGCTLLIWSISGQLQGFIGPISLEKRMLTTLAFAWNPLLLIEACVNAHNDVVILFFILLMFWVLVRSSPSGMRASVLAAGIFALATCLKLNVAVLAPGLFGFLYLQHPRSLKRCATAALTYVGIILLLYAPFWQDGALLNLFRVNPGTNRDINTFAEFLAQLYNGIAQVHAGRAPTIYKYVIRVPLSSPAELFTHTVSMAVFVILYGLYCWRVFRTSESISSISGLISWMAIVWLLYSAIGSPWFWPWYLVTFFGLFALLEVGHTGEAWSFGLLRLPLATRLLVLSMLSLYCFYTWAPQHTSPPFLPGFLWTYFRGLYIWTLPLFAIGVPFWMKMLRSWKTILIDKLARWSRAFQPVSSKAGRVKL